MKPIATPGETRCFGKPENWDPATMGECGVLSIRDEVDPESKAWTMCSTWEPSESDLKVLANGGKLRLRIFGRIHPVVSLGVVGDKE